MTNKKTYRLVILMLIPAILIAFYIFARLMNWFQFYKIPTTNMEPKYKIGNVIAGSNLLNVSTNNIIAYKADPSIFDQAQESYVAIARVVGTDGDTIELKNGFLFRNNKMVDDTLNLSYKFSVENKYINVPFSKYELQNSMFQNTDTSVLLNLTYSKLKQYNITSVCKRIIDTTTLFIKPGIFGDKYYEKKWTLDNFGPVVVPVNYMFLLGDNRSNSVDSRIRGFISREQIQSKIID